MILEQQRISLKGSDERIDYFTELLKHSKSLSETSGAGVLLEATILWKKASKQHSLLSHKSPPKPISSSSGSTRNCYLFVFTPPRDFEYLVDELNSLKTDKAVKRLIEGKKVGRNEVLLEALILVLEYLIQRKEKEWQDEKIRAQDLVRHTQPWTPVHDQAIRTKMEIEETPKEEPPPSFVHSSERVPIMTLKERKIYAQELQTYLYVHPPDNELPPGFENSDISNRKRLGIDCDEVYPGIVLGNGCTLKNIKYLKKIGITHVLNAAEFRGVNLNASYFENSGIFYKGLRIEDTPQTQICRYFPEVSKYIGNALSSSANNKIYVNCLFGKSRSTTCIVAYLMLIQGWSALEALSHIRKKRNVLINYGFLNQIADLDHRLKWEASRHAKNERKSY